MLKLNLGCGHSLLADYENVDKSFPIKTSGTFRQYDLEKLDPRGAVIWPWETDSVSNVLFIHSLEHMGKDASLFCSMMQELYRVCVPDAEIMIAVPHPRHDDFINDPTHVRIITPEVLQLFSKKFNRECIERKASNTTLGLYLNVDFEIEVCDGILAEPYLTMSNAGTIDNGQLHQLIRSQNNIVKEFHIKLRVRK